VTPRHARTQRARSVGSAPVDVSEWRNKASTGQQGDGPVFCQFHHDGFTGLAAAQIGDHAVGTCIGVNQAAVVAVDQQWWTGVGGEWISGKECHTHIMETGWDTPLTESPKLRLICNISRKSTGARGWLLPSQWTHLPPPVPTPGPPKHLQPQALRQRSTPRCPASHHDPRRTVPP